VCGNTRYASAFISIRDPRRSSVVASTQQSNGTLLNYVDQPDSFADSASTALLAATTFRYSLLTYDGKHDLAAMQALSLVWQSIDQNGWLLNVVDPETFTQPLRNGAHSPEAQSFVLLLAAAWAVF
jgi:hypothetical protein